MLVKCDVVKCIYNEHCKCEAGVVEITLAHDGTSLVEHIECATCVIEEGG
jgi:hypothetical protein